ncbi:GNAT family N-acetyltransferase [Xanthobacter sp. V2C-8]|uniref:GNAT family N-acetyltransferase n=1 Tax=Xanthobacter albus TaxID=3119929 RepID=UPI00372BCC45
MRSAQALTLPVAETGPRAEAGMVGGVVAGMSAICPKAWRAARPPESEGWAYLAACEAAPMAAMELAAARVEDAGGLRAAAPLFALSYRLDTPIQSGRLGAVAEAIFQRAPRLLEWRMLGVGSAFTDACPIALDPRLDAAGRAAALAALIRAVEAEAARRGAGLVAFKDVAPREAALAGPVLEAAGYVQVESLPVAVLDLDGCADLDAYLARLSRATRKDLRRKLKGAPRVAVEWRSSIAGLETEIAALYEATRTRSTVRYGDFEDLPEGYFARVAAAMPGEAVFALYRVDGVLAGFNLLLVEADRVIDKFLGMVYPLGPDHDLYALSWLENVRFCQRIGRRFLQTGQTAYASKLRFGSHLDPRTHFVRHRNGLLHAAVRLAAPLLSFPRWDPELGRRQGEERP